MRMPCCERLRLADDALLPVHTLPYGKQRLVEIAIALGLNPSVLLLDEPAAGVPSVETRIILDVIEQLPDSIAVLIIEHDMDLVFRFARRITVLVQGGILVEGTPARDRRRCARARSLSRRAPAWLRRGSNLRDVSAGYGETVVLDGVSLALAAGGTLAVLGRNGVGKIDAAGDHHGPHDAACRPHHVPRTRDRAPASVPPRPPWHRLRAAGARDLSVAECRGEPDRRARAAPAWTHERVYALFPRLAERRRSMGNQLSGGEQQMLAIGRALMLQSVAAAAG